MAQIFCRVFPGAEASAIAPQGSDMTSMFPRTRAFSLVNVTDGPAFCQAVALLAVISLRGRSQFEITSEGNLAPSYCTRLSLENGC